MRLQLVKAAEHGGVVTWPFDQPLDDWSIDGMHNVSPACTATSCGCSRWATRRTSSRSCPIRSRSVSGGCCASWPRPACRRPKWSVVVTGRDDDADGLLITRHLDYSLPYRTLLSGRGLRIPYLGERCWMRWPACWCGCTSPASTGATARCRTPCSGATPAALSAYIIDVETGERHEDAEPRPARLDLQIATENVLGGLLDLQMGGHARRWYRAGRYRPGDRELVRGACGKS
jgi:hypothetical protein